MTRIWQVKYVDHTLNVVYLVYLFISMWFMVSLIVMLVLLAFVHHKDFTLFLTGQWKCRNR